MLPAGRLCLHTPRADCNEERRNAMKYLHLCLHTLRADCNGLSIVRMKLKCTFASTRSVQIATVKSIGNRLHTIFASTRSVQIATQWQVGLHVRQGSLPPHAPCRLQPFIACSAFASSLFFASTRSVQIATIMASEVKSTYCLCLHTLRADCNGVKFCFNLPHVALPPHAPCRLQHTNGGI